MINVSADLNKGWFQSIKWMFLVQYNSDFSYSIYGMLLITTESNFKLFPSFKKATKNLISAPETRQTTEFGAFLWTETIVRKPHGYFCCITSH